MAVKRTALLMLATLVWLSVFSQPVTIQKSEVRIVEGGQTFYVHTVAPGQTLWSIAKAYDVDQSEITRYNPSAAAGLLAGQELRIPDKTTPARREEKQEPPKAPDNGYFIHNITSGETLYGIARKYGITVQELLGANAGMTEQSPLQVGQELKIPAPKGASSMATISFLKDSVVIHNVQKGESLYGIAQQYKVNIDSLIAWNPDLSDKPLRKGQDLRILLKVKTVQPKPEPAMAPQKTDTILHQIQDKETIWGLAKRYNTTVEEILALNPELKDGLKKGYYIYIPVTTAGGKAAAAGKKEKGCEYSRYRSKYKIALMIPLYLDEIDRIQITPGNDDQIRKPFFKPFGFVEFYEGFLLAVDSMKRQGLSVDLYVYDTGNDSNMVKKILAKPELPYMDLIVGPFFSQNYNLVTLFAIQHNIKIVSPFARNQQLVSQHANVFQLNAASESKMAELARHIAISWQEPNVIMVTGNTETDRSLAAAFKQRLELQATMLSRKPQYTEVNYRDKGLAGVSTKMDVNRPNIIVNLITGETMVSNYVANMAKLTKNFDITMFGLPEWQDYRTFDLADLMAVKLHLFANAFVDYENPAAISFIRKFREQYKGDPEESNYGFLGYDIGLYFLKALFEFGLDFENCLDQVRYVPVSTDFKWEQVNNKGYENIYLNIYRFNDYKLEPVRQPR